jgi:hypothetical protein
MTLNREIKMTSAPENVIDAKILDFDIRPQQHRDGEVSSPESQDLEHRFRVSVNLNYLKTTHEILLLAVSFEELVRFVTIANEGLNSSQSEEAPSPIRIIKNCNNSTVNIGCLNTKEEGGILWVFSECSRT